MTGKNIRTLSGHRDKVVNIVISEESKVIVSGSCDKTIKIWDI